MKNYTITVNGTAYQVTVEEGFAGAAAPAPAPAPAAAPAPAPAPAAPAPAAAPAGAGEVVEAPMPGKVLRINKHVGDAVAAGDEVLVLEAMKMGNPIMAPCDGKITGMPVSEGQSVQGGDTLFTVG